MFDFEHNLSRVCELCDVEHIGRAVVVNVGRDPEGDGLRTGRLPVR